MKINYEEIFNTVDKDETELDETDLGKNDVD